MLKPLGKNVVVVKDRGATETETGIQLPDSAIQTKDTATVVSVGPDVTEQVSAGDQVIVAKFAGVEFEVDGNQMSLVNQRDLLAVLDG